MELQTYLNLARKWLWLILLAAVLAGVSAFIVSRNQVPIYQATSTILINQARSAVQTSDYNDILTSQRMAQTYAKMLQDWEVQQQVAEELGLAGTFEQIRKDFFIAVNVVPVRDTQLVNVQVESSDPELSAAIANTLPEVFGEINQARQQDRYATTRQALQRDLTAVEAEMTATQQALSQLVEPETTAEQAEQARLQGVLRRYETSYAALLNSLEQLRLTEAQTADAITTTSAARAPTAPVRPRVMVNTLLALVVGAMLGLGGALLLEYFDDTVKTPDDVRKTAGLATLGGVVMLEGANPDDRLVVRDMPRSPGAEAYRVLRTNLQFSSVDAPLATLLITSAGPGEGKSTTTTNLAVAMAQGDKRVILVDADLRRPSQHRLLHLVNNVGLSTALLDKSRDPAVYLQDTTVPNLRVMTTGPIPPNPAELLSSARMHEMIELLKGEADVVLFDTPPVLAVADTSILARQVDGTLLVVASGETRRDMVAQAMQSLKSVGVSPLGAVLNKLTQRKSGYYYYYYYHYASRYGEDGANANGRKPGNGRFRRPSGRRKAEQAT
jgi:non-specific protein-tyrosine kinase